MIGYEIADGYIFCKMLDENKLVFCDNESMFILPDQELTDEELLQIIDFLYKRDYSLQEANANSA